MNLSKIIGLAILLCTISNSVNAQFYSYKQLVKQADKAYEQAHFPEAIEYYSQAKDLNKDYSEEILFRMGDAAFQIQALDFAENALNSYLLKEEIPMASEAIFRLGRIAHLKGDYEQATRQYDLYLSEYDDVNEEFTKSIEFLKTSADWAANANVENTADTIMRLGNDINSPQSDNAPFLHEGDLYYSSLRFPIPKDKLKRHKSNLLKETDLVNIPGVSESQLVSNPSFNLDGDEILFSVCDYNDSYAISCKIYSGLVDTLGNIRAIEKLPEIINKTGSSTIHPTLDESGKEKVLYFSSDRNDGKGGTDVWKAFMLDDGTFSAPQNVSEINTSADELTPFFHSATKTLYYSSNGRKGYGGHDIYKLENGSKESINLGDKTNSSYNDVHYFLSRNGAEGYFSSNRPGSLFAEDKYETCCYDIYKAQIKDCNLDLKTLSFDKDTKEPLAGVRIKIYDKETEEVFYDGIPEKSPLELNIPCNENWNLIASKEGYNDLETSLSELPMIYGQENIGQKNLYLTKDLSDIDLTLQIFEEVAKRPIEGATVYLTDMTTMEQVEIKSNPSNTFNFALKANRDYTLEINKDGFKEKTINFNSGYGDVSISKEAILNYLDIVEKSIVSLQEAIPVSLYFDNDSPNPRTTTTTSTKTYSQTFDSYYAQKDKFKNAYLGLFNNSSDKVTANDEVENLFEGHIKRGFERYDVFKNQLLVVLQDGQDVNIYLKGYASPIAKSDYNSALGKRRVDSIRKEFDSWNNGALLQYIRSGQLVVTERSFGETTSPAGVSDDPGAPSKSIYSPGASLERRVEIEEINFNEQ